MSEYEQIIKRATEQGLNFSGKHVVIPREENSLVFDGELVFGRIFEEENLLYILREVETEWGNEKQPFLYLIEDTYTTWIQGGTLAYKVGFFIVK